MERSQISSLRSLPRFFIPDLDPESDTINLPSEEYDKIHKVLRLSTGAEIAVLPNNGEIWRCTLRGRSADITARHTLATEALREVTLAQAMPRPEKLEEVIRMGSEMGITKFIIFPSERTVVRWDEKKREDRLRRLRVIARESCEVSFRTRLPEIEFVDGLQTVITDFPAAIVLSEFQDVSEPLSERLGRTDGTVTLVIGPEGGWTRREVELIGTRATTLGPRVLRVDTAAAAACSLALLS